MLNSWSNRWQRSRLKIKNWSWVWGGERERESIEWDAKKAGSGVWWFNGTRNCWNLIDFCDFIHSNLIQHYHTISSTKRVFLYRSISIIALISLNKPNRNHSDRLIIKVSRKKGKAEVDDDGESAKARGAGLLFLSAGFSASSYFLSRSINFCLNCSFCSANLGFACLRNSFVLFCWTCICGNHRGEREDRRKKSMKTGSSTLDLTSLGLLFLSPLGFVYSHLCDSLCISVLSLCEIPIWNS